MPAPPPDARSFLAQALRVVPCGGAAAILTVRAPAPLPTIRASRFFMLRREDGSAPLIPRPYSIYKQRGAELDFLILRQGQGSSSLLALQAGMPVRLIGPLGNGWPDLASPEPAAPDPGASPADWVLLAGGVGSAPFYMAIEQALAGTFGGPVPAHRLHFLFGARSRAQLYDLPAFEALGVPVHTATQDGSHGRRGHVLELLESLQREGRIPATVRALACGPERMLEAVHAWSRRSGQPAYLSLETLMGCGVGICNGCPVPTDKRGPLRDWPNAKACVEGPVFRADAIELCH
jgi:dihydroorotate dehydrogenase electron transfer subunit